MLLLWMDWLIPGNVDGAPVRPLGPIDRGIGLASNWGPIAGAVAGYGASLARDWYNDWSSSRGNTTSSAAPSSGSSYTYSHASGTDSLAPYRRIAQSLRRQFPTRRSRMGFPRRSYGRGRMRSRFRPRLRRRVIRRSIKGRRYVGNSKRQRCLTESVPGNSVSAIGAGGTSWSANTNYQVLPEWTNATGVDGIITNGTMTYVIYGSLQSLFNNNLSFANAIANSWDLYRLDWITFKLKASFRPNEAGALTLGLAAAATQYDLRFAPQYDDNVSWQERDGTLGFTTVYIGGPPNGGDLSTLVANRHRARRHRAFTDIVRRMRPTCVSVGLGAAAGSPLPNVSNITPMIVSTRSPLQTNPNSPVIYYGMGIAFSNKSPSSSTVMQPKHYYDVETIYDLTLFDPLF